jgi:hypothetical protein
MFSLLMLALLRGGGVALANERGEAEELRLYPTFAHDSVGFGAYRTAVEDGPGVVPDDLENLSTGFELHYREVQEGWRLIDDVGHHYRVQLRRDGEGRTVVDRLTLMSRFGGVHIHPEAGDMLQLSLIGGDWDQMLWSKTTGWTQVRLFAPVRLTLLGFSDTDADDDTKLKYFAAAGAGFGADWAVRVYRRVGFQLRVEGAGDSMFRHRADQPEQVRLSAGGRGEFGFAIFDPDVMWILGAWAEHRTQWEIEDDPSGVDRQLLTAGIRVAGRLIRQPVRRPDDLGRLDPAPPTETRAHRRKNDRNDKAREDIVRVPATPEEEPPRAPDEQTHEAANTENSRAIEENP